MTARTPDKTARSPHMRFPLFPFTAGSLLPAGLGARHFIFRRPGERQQKGAVLGRLHIVRHALIQCEQAARGKIYYPPRQVEPDMARKRVHRDPACRCVLMHARIRLHGDQNNAEVRVLHERLRTSSRGLKPGFVRCNSSSSPARSNWSRGPQAFNRLCPTPERREVVLGSSHT